jgi:hypothetical protein
MQKGGLRIVIFDAIINLLQDNFSREYFDGFFSCSSLQSPLTHHFGRCDKSRAEFQDGSNILSSIRKKKQFIMYCATAIGVAEVIM